MIQNRKGGYAMENLENQSPQSQNPEKNASVPENSFFQPAPDLNSQPPRFAMEENACPEAEAPETGYEPLWQAVEETENPVEIRYLPDGRRTSFPEQPGVYLRKRGGQVEKIYWKQP